MAYLSDFATLWHPALNKTAKIYPIAPQNANADLAVTRAGSKYSLDKNGLLTAKGNNVPALEYSSAGVYQGLRVERARTNYCLRSEDLTLSWTKGAGCSISATNITAPDGNNTADRVTGCTGAATWLGANTLSQQVGDGALPLGGPLTFSVWLKSAGATTVQIRLRDQGSGAEASRTVTLSSTWTRYELSRTNGTAAFSINAGIYFALADGDFDFWGGQLEVATSATSYIPVGAASVTYIADDVKCTTLSSILNNVNREGTVEMVMRRNLQQFQAEMFNLTQASASDTNRVFLRTTGADRIQAVVRTTGSRTNLMLQSADFSTTWSNSGTTETVNNAIAPDGTVTADSMLETATTAEHFIFQNVTTVASTVYTFSCFIKARNRNFGRISMISNSAGFESVICDFDLNTGTVTGSVAAGGTLSGVNIEMVGNGWYRISVSGTIAAKTDMQCRIAAKSDAVTLNYAGNTSNGFDLWGAQLETGATATAYIPTTTVAVTAGFNETVIAQTPASHTNLAIRSEEFDNASWTKTDTTVSANNVANPLNGTVNADLLTEGTAGTAVTTSANVAVLAGTPYTGSLYLRRSAGADWVRVAIATGGSDIARFWFNLATGAAGATTQGGTATALGRTIESLGNGWYRVIVSASFSSAGNAQLSVHSASADSSTTRVNSSAYWAYGAQLEIDGTASRYIATGPVAVTDSPAVGLGRLLFRYKDNDCRLLLNGQVQNAWTFTVSGVTTSPVEGSSYTFGGVRYRVISTSITAGSGTIRARMISGTTEPSGSGSLTKVGGIGDASISFSAVAVESVAVTIPGSLAEAYIGGRTTGDNANFIAANAGVLARGLSNAEMTALDTQLATVYSS